MPFGSASFRKKNQPPMTTNKRTAFIGVHLRSSTVKDPFDWLVNERQSRSLNQGDAAPPVKRRGSNDVEFTKRSQFCPEGKMVKLIGFDRLTTVSPPEARGLWIDEAKPIRRLIARLRINPSESELCVAARCLMVRGDSSSPAELTNIPRGRGPSSFMMTIPPRTMSECRPQGRRHQIPKPTRLV